MRCGCHGSFFLSLGQERALDLLQAWVARNGSHSLCTRLVRGDAEAQRVYNQCNYQFSLVYRPRRVRPAGLEGLSALAVACHFACIPYDARKSKARPPVDVAL